MTSVQNIPAGLCVPQDCWVVIEIRAHERSVKYEMDKEWGVLKVDRFFSAPMNFPCNYGYIPQTLAPDGDPVDALVLSESIQPGALIRCRPLGLLNMSDEAGHDAKVLMVPHEKIAPGQPIHRLEEVPQAWLRRIEHFFSHYKTLDANKWVKIEGWLGLEAAEQFILESAQRFLKG